MSIANVMNYVNLRGMAFIFDSFDSIWLKVTAKWLSEVSSNVIFVCRCKSTWYFKNMHFNRG